MKENIYNPEFVKGLFNRMSASYERMNYITSFGFSIRWRRQFLNTLESTDRTIEVLDLLTGMGETWSAVKHKFPNATLSALDFSTGMLEKAKKKNETHFNNQVKLLQQDLLQNQLPDNHFDIVICSFGLKTFNKEQLQILAAETKRVLKQNGHFSFVEVSKPKNPVLRSLYRFYLGRIIPILGKLLLGDPTEYKMLWRYTEEFGTARETMDIFKQAGLNVQYHSFFFDCATGFSGTK